MQSLFWQRLFATFIDVLVISICTCFIVAALNMLKPDRFAQPSIGVFLKQTRSIPEFNYSPFLNTLNADLPQFSPSNAHVNINLNAIEIRKWFMFPERIIRVSATRKTENTTMNFTTAAGVDRNGNFVRVVPIGDVLVFLALTLGTAILWTKGLRGLGRTCLGLEVMPKNDVKKIGARCVRELLKFQGLFWTLMPAISLYFRAQDFDSFWAFTKASVETFFNHGFFAGEFGLLWGATLISSLFYIWVLIDCLRGKRTLFWDRITGHRVIKHGEEHSSPAP